MLSVVALCTALLSAHFTTALHAFEHDLDAPDGKVCLVCITAAQLGAACVDTNEPAASESPGFVVNSVFATLFSSTHIVTVRQRGPPASA